MSSQDRLRPEGRSRLVDDSRPDGEAAPDDDEGIPEGDYRACSSASEVQEEPLSPLALESGVGVHRERRRSRRYRRGSGRGAGRSYFASATVVQELRVSQPASSCAGSGAGSCRGSRRRRRSSEQSCRHDWLRQVPTSKNDPSRFTEWLRNTRGFLVAAFSAQFRPDRGP